MPEISLILAGLKFGTAVMLSISIAFAAIYFGLIYLFKFIQDLRTPWWKKLEKDFLIK